MKSTRYNQGVKEVPKNKGLRGFNTFELSKLMASYPMTRKVFVEVVGPGDTWVDIDEIVSFETRDGHVVLKSGAHYQVCKPARFLNLPTLLGEWK